MATTRKPYAYLVVDLSDNLPEYARLRDGLAGDLENLYVPKDDVDALPSVINVT